MSLELIIQIVLMVFTVLFSIVGAWVSVKISIAEHRIKIEHLERLIQSLDEKIYQESEATRGALRELNQDIKVLLKQNS